ncbi:MAG: RNA methyltransferase [Bacteroidetes bacterium]|nr:RNA methyltransferase [Bacteroidota bacterium]
MAKIITSLQNPTVKNVLLLGEKPRARKEQNRIVIEGLREIRLAILSGFKITDLFYTSALISDSDLHSLELQHNQVEPTEISAEVFNRMAYRNDSGGLIALAEPRRLLFSDLKLRIKPLLLVLETVEKPGNLGALLRTADAANLDAVIICDPQTDIYNPNAIRSGIGCIFTMPVVTSTSEDAIAWMKTMGIKMFGTALTATHFYHETNFDQPAAVIMGSEANGLSKTWLSGADDLIKIPMKGKIDSMNVSASAAIVIFEAMRQRNFG